MLVDGLLPLGQVVLVHVADGDDLDIGAAEDLGQVPVDPVIAATDQPDPDALAGGRDATSAERRGRNERREAEAAVAAAVLDRNARRETRSELDTVKAP